MAVADRGEAYQLRALLSGDGRDFLIRNNGDQVEAGNLDGKTVGIYFSGHWCPTCRWFTLKLAVAYNELAPKGFEVVFVSSDRDEDSFQSYFSEVPWLAVPFSDADVRARLNSLFKVRGIPHLVILDGSTGRVLMDDAVKFVGEYGTEAYPFTPERLSELREAEEAAKRNQTLHSVLATSSRDFVFNSNGDKVPIAELEGKIVCVYFSVASFPPSIVFSSLLTKVYEELKSKGEPFEVVLVSLESDELEFEEDIGRLPWLALPFKDKALQKLPRYFGVRGLPTVVVIGPDGKTLHGDATELVEEHGAEAYPFSAEKLAALERARQEAQTLESILVSGELDHVIAKDGAKIPVSELVGKNILLYFSAHWCPPCRLLTPKLVQVYNEIKAKDSAFELVFISSDRDQASFDEYFSGMPWLALPFGDERKKSLSRKFKVQGIPSLAAIGPSGRTATTEARRLVDEHGAGAYPFTFERIEQLEREAEERAQAWPKELTHQLHEEHELVLTRRIGYICDACDKGGAGWSFYCDECDFDLHPKCALEPDEKEGEKEAL
ncbi:hypothetical protein Taro_012021 [Colocasia esculenta]|uniref:protein-disulfide reductase n=1 Tax=Colocasia esculenta TaxID=4460 RepID=A0A843UBR5_COLES|nr:hypothetical protein [Colocasia esculenta]